MNAEINNIMLILNIAKYIIHIGIYNYIYALINLNSDAVKEVS